MSDYLANGPTTAKAIVILAHGAGAPMDSPFMDYFAAGIAEAGFQAVRFEFDYMADRRRTGKKRGPGSANKLLEEYTRVVEDIAREKPKARIFVGGKSMGGRVGSMIADSNKAVRGVICLGYPFHPPGAPDKLRTEHLEVMTTPTLIVQGTRDTFGTVNDVEGYSLSNKISVHWLEDGDHSFKPRKSSGRTEAQNWQEGVTAVVKCLKKCTR